ncbi:MAG: pyrroline-5-carboxylate reductase [Vampirovibrionales bacterium]|nr:pyrroline-5-carboxylate reductase [Vampirovibrionales bacterium]
MPSSPSTKASSKPLAFVDSLPLSPTDCVGVVGAGVMGRTFLKAWLDKGLVTKKQLWATAKTPTTCQRVSEQLGITAVTVPSKAPLAKTKVILVCVKPYQLEGVMASLRKVGVKPSTLIISVVAGKNLDFLQAQLEENTPVIRAMPNTPAVVGQGMSVICPGDAATEDHLAIARTLFGSVGQCLQLDEHHFDAVTGLCGSGPAYMYLIMEALADGGVRVGLPRDVALAIVTQTVLGAAAMVQQSGRHPAALRDDVTTPAGCTIAGLLTLEDGKIRSVLARAVEEATKTAKGLG